MGTDWIKDMAALVDRYDMLPAGGTVLCAVSGGIDSVFLLHELKELAPVRGFRLAAAHYNHRLRGAESDRDETFVRELCGEWHIPCEIGAGEVRAEAKRRKRGIEETAREMRYAFLNEAAGRIGASRIAVAHNADDNAETVLLHLVRGCGLQGLTGMAPRQGRLVRPLLCVSRAVILEEHQRYGLPHVEDSTNADERLSRNRLRRQVMPVLKDLNPRLIETLSGAMARLGADNDYLNSQADLILSQAVLEGDGLSLSAALIASAPDPLAVRAVRRLLSRAAGGDTDCASAHLEAVVALCRGEDPSGEVHLPGGRTARRVYDRLVLTGESRPAPLAALALHEGENPIPGTDWTAVLDGPPWPGLEVRGRRVGDELTLPGGRSRSLKKLLIDKKIPRWDRDGLPVAADGDGVVAVAGLGPNTAHPRYPAAVTWINKKKGREPL